MATKGLFVTGTSTDIGKTYVSCHLLREMVRQGKSVGAYKPVCSGAVRLQTGEKIWEDVEKLHRAIQSRVPENRISPQTFDLPLAPDRAAKSESRLVDESLLVDGWKWWLNRVDYLLVEGVGGLLSPVSENFLVADLALQIGYPLLIVADAGLGTINHTLLTIEAARNRGLKIAAVLLNHASPQKDESAAFNREDLSLRTKVPILGEVDYCTERLKSRNEVLSGFDWSSLFCESVQATQGRSQ